VDGLQTCTERAKQARGEILGPNYTLQFVPFQTPDYKAKSNPQKDYKDWVKAMEDVMNKQSDLPFNFKIVVPDKYFMIPNNLKTYGVGSKSELMAFININDPNKIKILNDKHSKAFTRDRRINFVGVFELCDREMIKDLFMKIQNYSSI
jgi:hypothetical protein